MQIERAYEDGRVTFQNGSVVLAQVILHCTGYFEISPGAVMFCLSWDILVSLPDSWTNLIRISEYWRQVVPFILCEVQSRWIAGTLSGRISLPSEEKMMEDIESFYSKLDAAGVPKRYTHNIGDHQFDYDDWLATETASPLVEEWRKGMYRAVSLRKRAKPETYRDEWDDEEWKLQAYI